MRAPFDSKHWPEYLIEAAALGLFMVSAAVFTVLLEHPDSSVRMWIDAPALRRLLMGLAMGGTAIAIIYSPFGVRSGAHMNPAVTLTFARLGKIAPRDAVAYIVMHFAGAFAGLAVTSALLTPLVAHPSVNYIATVPGAWGDAAAFAAEALIAFVMMTVILTVSASRRSRLTGLAAGALLALYIFIEAPVSGTSLNPARSFAPALLTGDFRSQWIYLGAPTLGMALGGEAFTRSRSLHAVLRVRLNPAGGDQSAASSSLQS